MKRNNNKHIKKLKRASELYGMVLDNFLRNWTASKRNNKRLLAVIHKVVKKLNRILTSMGGVPAKFLGHYNGGVKQLIKDILSQLEAYPKDNRAEAIKSAKYADEILLHTQMLFTLGTSRYQQQTVRNALREMVVKNQIGQIILKPDEDVDRECSKPRAKYYLLP